MVDVVEEIRAAMPRLRPAEARVGAVVLEDPEAAAVASISELADRAEVSQASVVRFSQALGFAGLPELRSRLTGDLSRRALELERSNIAEGEINDADSALDVVTKLAFHEARAIEHTAMALDLDALDRAAVAMARADRLVGFGVGASGLVVEDLSQKLQRIGCPFLFSADTHVQLANAALAGPGGVAFGASFRGATDEVVRGLRVAHGSGALTVALTNVADSPVGRAADVVLTTSVREAQFRAAAMASRMAQLAVVDFLFVRVAQQRFDNLAVALEATRAAVRTT